MIKLTKTEKAIQGGEILSSPAGSDFASQNKEDYMEITKAAVAGDEGR